MAVALDAANNASGYNTWIGRDIEAMNAESSAREAAAKCLMGRSPKLIEARPMTAILEPPAVAQLFFHLNFRSLGVLGAQSAGNHDNIVFDNLGERIAADDITVYDEMMTDGLVPMPFDYEGVAKQRLDLTVKGVAKGIAHDLTASCIGTDTGNRKTGIYRSPPFPHCRAALRCSGSCKTQNLDRSDSDGRHAFQCPNCNSDKRTVAVQANVEAGEARR